MHFFGWDKGVGVEIGTRGRSKGIDDRIQHKFCQNFSRLCVKSLKVTSDFLLWV